MIETIAFAILVVITILIAVDISLRVRRHINSKMEYKRMVDRTLPWVSLVLNKSTIDKSVIDTAFISKTGINKVAILVQDDYVKVFKRLSLALNLPVDPGLTVLVRSHERSYKERGVYQYGKVWVLSLISNEPYLSETVNIGSDDELREMAGNLTCFAHADNERITEMANVIINKATESVGV